MYKVIKCHFEEIKYYLNYLLLTGIHLALALDLLPCLSLNPFKALVKKNMHLYCTIKILISNTKDKVNVLQIKTDLLTIPFK